MIANGMVQLLVASKSNWSNAILRKPILGSWFRRKQKQACNAVANLGTKSAQDPREVRFLRYLHSKPLSQKRRQSGWYKQNLNKDSEFEAFLLAVLETNFQLCTKSTRPKFAQGTPQILTCYWLYNSLPSRDHHQRLEVLALQRPPKAFDPWKGSKDASHWMLGWEHMCCVCLCPSSTMIISKKKSRISMESISDLSVFLL